MNNCELGREKLVKNTDSFRRQKIRRPTSVGCRQKETSRTDTQKDYFHAAYYFYGDFYHSLEK